MKQNAGEGYPLLLAAGQRLVPRRVFLDLLLEVAEADLVQRLADFLDAPVFGGGRIGGSTAQGAADFIVSAGVLLADDVAAEAPERAAPARGAVKSPAPKRPRATA